MTAGPDTVNTPPQDISAERAVLGLAMSDPRHLAAARAHLNGGQEFYRPVHEQLWLLLCREADAGRPVSQITISTAAIADKSFARQFTSNPTWLFDLIQAGNDAGPHAGTFAQIVRDAYRLRRWRETGLRIAQMTETADPDEIDLMALDQLEQAVHVTEHARDGSVDGIMLTDWEALFDRPRTPPDWIAAPLVAKGRVTLLYSPGKSGKSLIAQEIAVQAALGDACLGSGPYGAPRHTLYIDQEMTEEDWRERLDDMGHGREVLDVFDRYLHLAQLQAWPAMDTLAGGAMVAKLAQAVRAELVIIDTVSKVVEGEENSNDTHGAFYRSTLVPLKRAGCAVLVLDHTGKDIERGARGGSSKTDNVDLAFELLIRGKGLLSLRRSHARFRDPDWPDDAVMLRRHNDPLRHEVEERTSALANTPGATRPTFLMERVSRFVEGNPGVTGRAIRTAVKGKTEFVGLAVELLVTEGYLAASAGVRGGSEHRSVNPFREVPDSDEEMTP